MKILITSDNHLGYKEKDFIRGNDSFDTFEEILAAAQLNNVDFIIQGGDLFHDNIPSRNTMLKTVELLKKYLFGNKEINFECNIPLNMNDENLNIALPMIAIHGNHDDPSGLKIKSSLDILHAMGLVNYIGKTDSIEALTVDPVLISKDNKKVAIYGIGNIKDRRIYKLFKENKINFNRPKNYDEYINILLVHQNRIMRNINDYLPVEFIDDWFDVAIYGHEHDSYIYQTDSNNLLVLQCGSTVRTSLCEGEKGEKFAYILEIGESAKIQRLPLGTVRAFIMDDIVITDVKKMENIIKEKIEKMIGDHKMPLIRLRIDSNGEIINKTKFGIQFKNKVANYKDMLTFKRKKKDEVNEQQKGEIKEMKDILQIFMQKIDLKALPESLFVEGVKKFAETNEKDIFKNIVNSTIQNTVNQLKKGFINDETLEYQIKHMKNEINKENGYVKTSNNKE